jgi:peptidoglycan/LPS O-acetylase OafA/YrhL
MRFFPPLQPESGHLLHLDALRLIASAGIVIYHMSGLADAGAWSKQLVTVVSPFFLFVDMFFAISGFVIAFIYVDKIKDIRTYGSFLRKRLARLAPLHWATLAVFVALGMFFESHHIAINHTELYEWRCLPANLLFLHSTGLCPHLSFNGVSWSISAEMCMYLSTPAFLWLMRRSVAALGLFTAALYLALTFASGGNEAWLHWTSTGGFIRAIPSFAFGAWLFGVRGSLTSLPFSGEGFWLLILGFLVGSCCGLPLSVLLVTLYAAVTFGVAADAQQRQSYIVSKMAAGGQLTYSSYMLHPLVAMVVLNTIADRILHTHGFARNLLATAAFVAVWPVSYFSLVLFERPARRWIGGTSTPQSRSF